MKPKEITCFSDLKKYEGKHIGDSDYLKITQEMINQFADATLDHQWIHIDPDRAAIESPFKTTIAHGYLTLSVLPYLWDQIVHVTHVKLTVNYGIEKLKFIEPVKVNDEVRAVVHVVSVVDLRGITKAQMRVTLEIKGAKKSAFVTDVIFLYHFNS
ncbi:MAG: MaoC family dehydratase [Bacteroidales bacterium]|nr:MaoC family dehydratase [Bacteroidales bacterium]